MNVDNSHSPLQHVIYITRGFMLSDYPNTEWSFAQADIDVNDPEPII